MERKTEGGGNISSEKIDLLIYGRTSRSSTTAFPTSSCCTRSRPARPRAVDAAVADKIRGAAVTYNSVRGEAKTLARFPKLEIVSTFGVGYDHIDADYAREHNIVVTNTPDVLTEEVADIALGLLIATLREFIKADRICAPGSGRRRNFP